MQIQSPGLLLLIHTIKKLKSCNKVPKSAKELYENLDEQTNGLTNNDFFFKKKSIIHNLIKKTFTYAPIKEFETPNKNTTRDGMAFYVMENIWNEEKISNYYQKFQEAIAKGKYVMDSSEAYPYLRLLYKDLTEEDLIWELTPKKELTFHRPSDNKTLEDLVGVYFSYIPYQGLPRKGKSGTEKKPQKLVVRAVWKMEMGEREGKPSLLVTRKGLSSNIRDGYLEILQNMLYIHLTDRTDDEYTVYTSRKRLKNNEIKCNRIYAPQEQPFVFKEILLKQEGGMQLFKDNETRLIEWSAPEITRNIRNFISYPITPYHNNMKEEKLNALKGVWKVYFWQKAGKHEQIMRTCYMIITGQFNIRYKVQGHTYWNGYLQNIANTQKYSIIFRDDERHSVFSFELENISNLKNMSLIVTGYTVSGANHINSGIAVLKKEEEHIVEKMLSSQKEESKTEAEESSFNIHNLDIDNEGFDPKDINIVDFIKEERNWEILNYIPSPEFNVEKSSLEKHKSKAEWYFGNWLLFTIDGYDEKNIHTGELTIVSNSMALFNGSRTQLTYGSVAVADSKDVLEIELMGEKKKGFFIAKFTKGKDENGVEIGFVSIDTKQSEPSLGVGYLVRREHFLSSYPAAAEWSVKNYEKGSDLYQYLEKENIISKLHRLKVGSGNTIPNLSSFVKNFFNEYIPAGIMKKHQIFLESHINMLINTVQSQKLELLVSDKRVFSEFYKRILGSFSKGTLYATSLPSEGYFWKEKNLIEEETQKFVNEGGRTIRFFYIYGEEVTKKELSIIKRHFQIYGADEKGEVYITRMERLDEMEKCEVDKIVGTITIDSEAVNAWEVFVSPGESGRINKLIISSEKSVYEQHKEIFGKLQHSPATERVTDEWIEALEKVLE